MYEVLSPCGEPTVERSAPAPHLSDLNGKTIGEIWNGTGKGDEVFPVVREMLREAYPQVRIVPYTEFPVMKVIGETTREALEVAERAAARAAEKGCDAVIAGVGS